MLSRSSDQARQARGCFSAESLQPFYADALPGVREDCRVRPKIFNLSGEGIAFDDPPGGDSAPSPNPLPSIGMDAKLSAFLKRNLPDRWMDAIIFRLVGLPRQREQPADR